MPNEALVIITDLWVDDLALERDVLEGVADVVALGATSEAELIGKIDNADALICNHEVTIGWESINQLRDCRLIVRCGVGFENIDHQYAAERAIPVANIPDYGTEEVADSAIALLLALNRGANLMNSRLQRRVSPWNYSPVIPLRRLRGSVLGVIGFGAIGIATAIRAKAFGMDVVFFDPYARSGISKAVGVRRASSLDKLLLEAHAVSLHCGMSNETHHLINTESLKSMLPGAFLVNTARGPLVDTKAVLVQIENGLLGGVALDVLESEFPADDDPLIKAWRDPLHPAHDRVMITPHIAFYSEEGRKEMRIRSAQACRAALLGDPIPNVVNGVQ